MYIQYIKVLVNVLSLIILPKGFKSVSEACKVKSVDYESCRSKEK